MFFPIFFSRNKTQNYFRILVFTCDAYHMTEPHPQGTDVILWIEKALSQAGVRREDVNYINVHATSTPAGDLKEYQALLHCFGQNKELRVNSKKSMIGHLLGAAGAVEAVATVQLILCFCHCVMARIRRMDEVAKNSSLRQCY
ncbi:3-oxoacyl-[acyl-carrier-protein] synthase II, chloroplastic-like [Bidens hawaiensis]|uniref:3-oxoacyl-[acyl-carrier-protein] synthase II, chloroplastic-like n=1 Tax=Bidens hawaiensis TaxID=980011 RepID=UPI00404AEB72